MSFPPELSSLFKFWRGFPASSDRRKAQWRPDPRLRDVPINGGVCKPGQIGSLPFTQTKFGGFSTNLI